MNSELRGWIERHFSAPRGGRSKVMALADAIADNVRPGDAVHLGVTHSRGARRSGSSFDGSGGPTRN